MVCKSDFEEIFQPGLVYVLYELTSGMAAEFGVDVIVSKTALNHQPGLRTPPYELGNST